MPDLSFLDTKHTAWEDAKAGWERDERRFAGGYAVLNLEDFPKWSEEEADKYEMRRLQASYINLAELHAKTLAGHIGRVAPMPNFGTMGDVHERDDITSATESSADRFFYNCDGTGKDGTQFRAWATREQERALITGYRWTLVEMPRRPDGKADDAPITDQDIRNGHRAFVVGDSPLVYPYWQYSTSGPLDWAVKRMAVVQGSVVNGAWVPAPANDGYYLLVRENYAGLGDEFAEGGWWLFDGDKRPLDNGHGRWARTRGQIPLFPLIADASAGAQNFPASARSRTTELGQIGVALMNRISERDFDLSDGAKSVRFLLGANNDVQKLAAEQLVAGSRLVGVPPWIGPDGNLVVPTLWDSSSSVIPPDAFTAAITSHIECAHEIMVRQLTSQADNSGRSKEVGFGEATVPMLIALIERRETWENNILFFTEFRNGAPEPSGFVKWPREIEIAPLVAKVDRNLDRMLKIGARSATAEAVMVEAAARDDGLWPKDTAKAKQATAELTLSLSAVRPEQSESVAKLTSAGYSGEGAASAVGFRPELTALLVGGSPDGSPDAQLPEAGAVVGDEDVIEGGPLPPVRFSETDEVKTFGARDTTPNAPASAAPDLTPITEKLDALTAQIAALVQVITAKAAEPVAPVPVAPPPPQFSPSFDITLPPAPAAGKTIRVRKEGDGWLVQTSTDNGATPPPS